MNKNILYGSGGTFSCIDAIRPIVSIPLTSCRITKSDTPDTFDILPI